MAFLMKCRMSKVRTFESYSPVTKLRLMHSKHISKYDILSSDTFKKVVTLMDTTRSRIPIIIVLWSDFRSVFSSTHVHLMKKIQFTWVRKYL